VEGFVFQWDKACDAMPALRPASKILGMLLLLFLMFVLIPAIFRIVNENRPHPNRPTDFDAVSGKYLTSNDTNLDPADTFHNVETKKLMKAVKPSYIEFPAKQDENIVHAKMAPGIGEGAGDFLKEEDWDYKVEVAYIVDSAYGRHRLKIDTGVFVDSRELHQVSYHTQKVTLDPPFNNRAALENYNVQVRTLKSLVTSCTYYRMELFGQERLILGGTGGQINSSCQN